MSHSKIIGWLLSHGLMDVAVSLNSPHLESYIKSRLRQTPDDPDLRCLLWRQLERRGARSEAAQVLEHLAITPCSRLTLEDRLDFAARAIVAMKALPSELLFVICKRCYAYSSICLFLRMCISRGRRIASASSTDSEGAYGDDDDFDIAGDLAQQVDDNSMQEAILLEVIIASICIKYFE